MPFGLAVAPGTFQSVIEDMVPVLDTEDIMAYLDDVICFHPTFEKHLEGITRLFQMVRKSGFKLSGKKCQFATRSVKFLGHLTDKFRRSWKLFGIGRRLKMSPTSASSKE